MKRIGCLVIFLLLLVAGVHAQDFAAAKGGSSVSLSHIAGAADFTDTANGLTIKHTTLIDNVAYAPVYTVANAGSTTWGTGSNASNSDILMQYTYSNNGTLKGTIVLKTKHKISFPITLDPGSQIISYDGGYRIIPAGALSTNKTLGIPAGIQIPAPTAVDSLGKTVPIYYTYDGSRINITYDDTGMTYPITIDPTYYLASYDAYLKLMLHMNQSVAHPTWFNDSSTSNHIFQTNGDATTNTTSKQLGNASGWFDGTGDYITAYDSADWAMGSGNYTIMFWIQRTRASTQENIFGQTNSGLTTRSIHGILRASNYFEYLVSIDGSTANTYRYNTTSTITDTNWHQIVIENQSGKMHIYLDGVDEFLIYNVTQTPYDSASNLSIGRAGEVTSEYLTGNIDEFAIWKGTAVPISELYPQSYEVDAPIANFTQQDIWMEGQWINTIIITDASTGAAIPSVTVTTSNGLSYTTTNGTAYITEPSGIYVFYYAADGYDSRAISTIVDGDQTLYVQMTKVSATVPISITGTPKNVKFHIQSFFGAPIREANVTIQGITTTTGNWDWVALLLSIDLGEAPINSTEMSGLTDSNGDIVFLMLDSIKYNISVTAPGYTFPLTYISPQASQYTISANMNASWFPSGNDTLKEVNVSVSWVQKNATYAFINITYDDQTMTTTGGTMEVYLEPPNRVANITAITSMDITGSSCSNSTLVPTPNGGASYRVLVNATTSGENIVRTFTHYFKGSPVMLPGWTAETQLWLALFIIIFTAAFAGALHSPQMAVILCVEAWVFWAIGWLNALVTQFWYAEATILGVMTLASFITILWNITEGKAKGKRSS